MQRFVCKFGGSSLADAGQFRKVADIVKERPVRKYVVVSAPGKRNDDDIKVTDMLYSCFGCTLVSTESTGSCSRLFTDKLADTL